MAVTKCEQGHFYDGEKYDSCPHCKNPLPKRRTFGEEFTQYTPPISQKGAGSHAFTLPGADKGDERTVGVFQTQQGVDPVVGWLVCTQGTERGRAYLLHSGRNYVGRAIKSDICIPDDPMVTGEDHCSIVFEPKKTLFLLARGQGESVQLNGQAVAQSAFLTGDEEIAIGSSTFVFVPYCKEGRTW